VKKNGITEGISVRITKTNLGCFLSGMIQEAGRSGSNTHTLFEVLNGDFVSLAQLLEENAPIDILGIRGEGPIHIAVYRIDMRMLRMLLDHTPRANINFKNIEGNTALHIAANEGNIWKWRGFLSVPVQT